jgi:DNA-binding protein H-NS
MGFKEVVMDLEQLSKEITIDTSVSQDIAELCNKLLDVQKEVTTLEDKLKKKKEEELKLSEQDIPNLMQKAGVAALKLTNGSSVEIKPYYGARIPASRTDEAFDWLRENNYGDLIKNNVTLTFGRNEDNVAKTLVDELRQKGHNVKQAEKVEPMTLKAFVREQIEKGKNVPADLFGVYVATRTKITTKE